MIIDNILFEVNNFRSAERLLWLASYYSITSSRLVTLYDVELLRVDEFKRFVVDVAGS